MKPPKPLRDTSFVIPGKEVFIILVITSQANLTSLVFGARLIVPEISRVQAGSMKLIICCSTAVLKGIRGADSMDKMEVCCDTIYYYPFRLYHFTTYELLLVITQLTNWPYLLSL